MRLGQVAGLEKAERDRTQKANTEIYQALQRSALFGGHTKKYKPLNEEDEEVVPPQNKRVEAKVSELISEALTNFGKLVAHMGTKETANQHARADVVVHGELVFKQAPVTFLLPLQKVLTDIATMVKHIPILDTSEAWTKDDNINLYRSSAMDQVRTKKTQRPIVLYDATEKHPAQTQLITEDVSVGVWSTVKFSGAWPKEDKKQMAQRVADLRDAVEMAIEEANRIDVETSDYGGQLKRYILG